MAFTDGDDEELGTGLEVQDPNVLYLQYLEAQGGKMVSPLSQEGLELQAAYLKQMEGNTHPFDILRRISINPFLPPKDRIAASKTLLEYMARKVPSTLEVTGADGGPVQVDTEALKNLSSSELDMLSALLEKANSKKV